jgi:ribosomal protein S12 methylthiotransferase accessory factor YcaO
MERWAAARVFYEQKTPPTVPPAFLRQFPEECEIIETIEADGKYKVTVKDFSAGEQIPALGVIIEKTEDRSYRLNVGADTCFQVALSRCLTETYQGTISEDEFDRRLLAIPTEQASYFRASDEDALFQRYVVFSQFTKDGSGVFPAALFGDEPDHAFDPAVFTTRGSYEEEVRSLIYRLHARGHNVYIRDVSFLGFPSVFVYIPVISSRARRQIRL